MDEIGQQKGQQIGKSVQFGFGMLQITIGFAFIAFALSWSQSNITTDPAVTNLYAGVIVIIILLMAAFTIGVIVMGLNNLLGIASGFGKRRS